MYDNNPFIGYIPTENKKCVRTFKNKKQEELYSLKMAENLDEYGGVIAPGWVLIDIDDKKYSDLFLNIIEKEDIPCRVYETTRGKHFFFRNDGVEKNMTAVQTAIGIPCDVKVGGRNSYAILKYEGKKRPIIYDKYEEEEYYKIPPWAKPVPKTKIDFMKKREGEGRNNSLFSYILTLQYCGFSKDNIKIILNLINEEIFNKPLEKSEMEVILRDESFKQISFFDDNGKFLMEEFCQSLKTNCNIKKINGELCIYRNGIYRASQLEIEREMIKLVKGMGKNQRSECYAYLNLLTDEEKIEQSLNYIAFRNGVYNLETEELLDFSPEYYITNKINYNYNPEAKNEFLEIILTRLAKGDSKIKKLLIEIAGYCMYRNSGLRKAFVLIGKKRNGKSTYLDMLGRLLGNDNICALDLKELADAYKTAELSGKMACLGDDIDDSFIKSAGMFKRLVSGERISARQIYMPPFEFVNYAKLIFSANDMPRIPDKTGAVLDRLIFVPFENVFDKYLDNGEENPAFDPLIRQKLDDESIYEAFVNMAVEALKGVLKKNSFTLSEKSLDKQNEYNLVNNSYIQFFNEISKTDIENESVLDVYTQYKAFCSESGVLAISKIEFTKRIKDWFNVETKAIWGAKEKKTVRIFVQSNSKN